jgi:hypothetical protein
MNTMKDLEKATKQAARWARLFGVTVTAVGAATVLAGVLAPGWPAVAALASGLFAFNVGLQIVLDAEDND